MIDKFLTKLFGSSNQRYLKSIRPVIERINELEPELFRKVTALTKKDFSLLKSIGLFNSSLMPKERQKRSGSQPGQQNLLKVLQFYIDSRRVACEFQYHRVCIIVQYPVFCTAIFRLCIYYINLRATDA